MAVKNFIIKESYNDSVVLMNAANEVRNKFSCKDISAVMATPQNLELLESLGILEDAGRGATPADLVVAVKTESESAASQMLDEFKKVLSKKAAIRKTSSDVSFDEVLKNEDSLVLISIPGRYVRREAERAINAGKNVMVFSDNVSIEDEIFLKNKAAKKNLLFMGPDCGTAIINGKGLGFANVIRKGRIGIVGASGSGIQEVTTIIHKLGFGVSQAIGVGGRDVKSQVGGIMLKAAMDYFENDSETDIVTIISKPPDAEVADEIIAKAKKSAKKYVINFLTMELADFDKILFASTLEEAALKSCRCVDDRAAIPKTDFRAVKKPGKYLRGLYSGGTLCYEALYLLKDCEIYSNTPINKKFKMENPFKSEKHCLVDMGEDDFTRGYPHPMMDFTLRKARIEEEAKASEVGVLLLDCALGWGCHSDPAGELAPSVEAAKKINPELVVVASITGSAEDPQNYEKQKKTLAASGVEVFPTNAQAVSACRKILFEK